MFLNFATISFIATLLSFATSVTAHPTANLIREPKDSPRFAGAILSESTYDRVTSTFVIPKFGPNNSTVPDGTQYLNAVVGLQCTQAVRIYAFVGFSISPDGGVYVSALGPVPPAVSFNVGETARITVEVANNGYNATVENLTSGNATHGHMPSAIPPTCNTTVWGIEGPNSRPFVGSIIFFNTFARPANGLPEVGPGGATIQNIVTPNGANLTSTYITSSPGITISYL
ncbi:uncharacterized protein EI90DRAFT_3150157 [Cantharellus anzutake]|uniref:uncharacterized protein n=1 Tax=Cantharellus anzutake TaxID=1750568 RepID=UPI00190527D7|nr:uncharacterized protein EI90DRAFT_3150157 [Cantharellus anzutake]KAF8341978.1 hypothetical protein EI90DRAFT_3150157 [Cantharellus anzutake]